MPNPIINNRVVASSKLKYLLRDELEANLAAGSINGTPATIGPGTRTVTDINSVISMRNGKLSVIGTSNANDGYSIGSIQRIAGRMFLTKVTSGNEFAAAGSFRLGYSDGLTSSAGYPGIDYQTNMVSIRLKEGTSYVLTPTVGVFPHHYAFVLRSTGGYIFFRGSTGIWKLYYVSPVNATATLYPFMYLSSSTTNASIDYFRIPDELWLPIPLVYDSFNRTDGVLGDTDVKGQDNEPTPVRTWSGSSTFTISTNKVINTPATYGAEKVTSNPGFEDGTTGWTMQGTPTTWEQSSTKAHGGTYSIHQLSDASNEGTTRNLGLTTGTWYLVDLWFYRVGGTYLNVFVGSYGTFANLTADVWTNIKIISRATSATLFLTSGGVSDHFYLDDISVKSLTLSELFTKVETSNSNVIATVKVTLGTANTIRCPTGIVLCLDSTSNPQNFLAVFLGSEAGASLQAICIDKCVGGTYTSLSRSSITYSAGATLEVIKDGTSISVVYNGSQVGTTKTLTSPADDAIINGTSHGLFGTYDGNSLDDFMVMPIGNNGEYEFLNKYADKDIPYSFSDSFTRGNGSLGAPWTGSTWTISGNKATNTPSTSVTTLSNDPGLEGTYTDGLCANFTKSGSPTVAESADAHEGSKAQSFQATSNYQSVLRNIGFPATGWYRYSAWAKRLSGSDGKTWLRGNNFGEGLWPIDSAVYEQFTGVCLGSTTTQIGVGVWADASSDVCLMDDQSSLTIDLASCMATIQTPKSDFIASVKVYHSTEHPAQAGLVLCLDNVSNPQNFILAIYNTDELNNLLLKKCVNGVYTELIHGWKSGVDGGVLKVVKIGSSVSMYYQDSLIGTIQSVTETGIINNTIHGMFSTWDWTLDDFTIQEV